MSYSGITRDPVVKPEWGAVLDAAHPLAQGLTGLWLLNEGSGNLALDATGNGNGALTAPIWTTGDAGPALSASASTHFVVPDSPGLRSSTLTLLARIYVSGYAASYQNLLLKNYTAMDASYQMYLAASTGTLNYYSNVSGVVSSGIAVPLNTWTLVAITLVGGTIRFYLGGKRAASGSAAATSFDANALYIASTINANPLVGKMDFAGVCNRALTDGEISEWANAPHAVILPADTRRFYGASGGQAWLQSLAEALNLDDARVHRIGKLVADSLALGDTRSIGALKSVAQSLAWNDAVTPGLNGGGQAWSKLLAETLLLSDARQSALLRRLAETLNLTDARALNLARQLGEVLGYTDGALATRAGLGVLTIVTATAFGDVIRRGGGKG